MLEELGGVEVVSYCLTLAGRADFFLKLAPLHSWCYAVAFHGRPEMVKITYWWVVQVKYFFFAIPCCLRNTIANAVVRLVRGLLHTVRKS